MTLKTMGWMRLLQEELSGPNPGYSYILAFKIEDERLKKKKMEG